MKNYKYVGRRVGAYNHIVMVVDPDTNKWSALDPSVSLKVREHSPSGFSWGYGGSGPAQLALALLLHAVAECPVAERPSSVPHEALAEHYYQMFKTDHVAHMQDNWTLMQADIVGWLRQVIAQAETKRKSYSYEPQFTVE